MKHQKILLAIACMLFCSLSAFAQPDADIKVPQKDQQILDDLIVVGSACVGQDCNNGESFGFDTIRLKENNLRIRFQDTSTSASFPTNDWQLVANDSSNGGANRFSIEDIDGSKTPFTILAGAPSNSLFVHSAGRIGLGTNAPVVELHVVNGDSPTLRLEQNGSSGFTPQTWDVAGNEANFFVRDATNGSKLPFKIKPGAPDNSIFIQNNGHIGAGTTSPQVTMDIRGKTGQDAKLRLADAAGPTTSYIEIYDKEPTQGRIDKVSATGTSLLDFNPIASDGTSSSTMRYFRAVNTGGNANFDIHLGDGTSVLNARIAGKGNATYFAANSGNVGIKTSTPAAAAALDVNGEIYKSGAAFDWSDKRLKSDISTFDKGLEEILKLNPINYRYNGQNGITNSNMRIGLIAQELQKVVPEMVNETYRPITDAEGNEVGKGQSFLAIKESALHYLMINAIKDQQSIIDQQATRLDALEVENQTLNQKIEELTKRMDAIAVGTVELNDNQSIVLEQNRPNPFDASTQISYFIPEGITSAKIQFSNINGQVIKTINITDSGRGVLNLDSGDLPSGTYSYSLYANGELIQSRKMVINR